MPKKVFKSVTETFDEGTSPGTYGQIRDRVTVESFGLEMAEVIDMRKPGIATLQEFNDKDTE